MTTACIIQPTFSHVSVLMGIPHQTRDVVPRRENGVVLLRSHWGAARARGYTTKRGCDLSGVFVTPTSSSFTLPDGRGVLQGGGKLANVKRRYCKANRVFLFCFTGNMRALVLILVLYFSVVFRDLVSLVS